MAVALSPHELERIIEVLSSAGQTLQLTRFERLSYRTLLVSVDVAIASFLGFILGSIFLVMSVVNDRLPGSWSALLVGVLALVFVVSILVGVVALVLNIPLLRKTFREEQRLKRLGVHSLSKSLWKESRRTRWISRLRGVLLTAIGILILVGMILTSGAAVGANDGGDRIFLGFMVLFYAIIAGLIFGARYLRNQRERMDLAASANELTKALQSLREREGAEVISVPAEFLEKTAIIESAQITKQRKDAVLQSAAFRPKAYAVAFSRDAAEQRAALSVSDRIELEDIVADLSTDGVQLEAQAEAASGTGGAALRATTNSEHVEVDCLIDPASRGIQIIALRHRDQASQASLNGAGNV